MKIFTLRVLFSSFVVCPGLLVFSFPQPRESRMSETSSTSQSLGGRPGWNPRWGIGPVIPPPGVLLDLKINRPALATPWPKQVNDVNAVDQSA
ncbi:hypothetical protein CPB84DRAFT_1787012 [Gymnopilus junonius]|uniref:Uncharacterized protein n=1 Tax=Gymnopilus junonius TaxID=109634 RepID=A0A9P5TKW2_GYMJU|nr:hypothetical protein CPB84DRAFT_1787012 [Gymnopilus junonius]